MSTTTQASDFEPTSMLTFSALAAAFRGHFGLDHPVAGAAGGLLASIHQGSPRFWELTAGSLLAYLTIHNYTVPDKLSKTQSNLVSATGLTIIGLGLFLTTKDHAFPGWWALLPVSGTVLVIAAGAKALPNRLILSNKIAVGVGLISYPLYLWHWPIFSFYRIIEGHTPSRTVRISLIVLSIILAYLTYRFVEKPLKSKKEGKIGRTATLSASMAVLFCAGCTTFAVDSASQTRMSPYINMEIAKALGDWDYPKEPLIN